KPQILEAFLNQVDLGHNWFGVEAAARHYFGTSASKLTLAQAASLAALPKSPPGYDPIRRPLQNRDRRNTILTLMADQKYITEDGAERAKAEAQSNGLGSSGLVNTDYIQGAIIVMDPYTGDVRALVGGRNYPLAPFNRAITAKRQPGSAIKPFVYAKAIEQGIPVNRVFN